MKLQLLALLLAVSISLSSQVIRSNSNKITIRDGQELKKDYWTLAPEVKPDIYETISSENPHRVTFISDIDSMSFDVKLDQTYLFVILLNGKDSAYTQISGVKQLTGVYTFVPPPPFSDLQIKQLTETVSSFKRIHATGAGEKQDLSDLAAFGKVVGNAQIIALGESTHGTGEFFSMKHRALEYAVTKLNVRVFAIEDNQLNVELVNNYVLNGQGKLLTVMRGMFGVWVRQEVLDMIEWLKKYNMEHPDKKVEFVGFDMQNPVMAFDSLESFLTKRDKEFNSKVQKLLFDYRKGFPNSYTAGDNDKTNWFNSTQQVLNMMRSEKNKWLRSCKNKSDSLSVEWAVQNANVIRQSARGLLTGQLKLYRDSAMAENIKWTLSVRKKGTRMLVWAHDFHISRGDDPIAQNNYYGGISMGSWLSKWYGINYKAFGLETFSGEFTAMKTYTDYNLIHCTLALAPVGTLDEALHQIADKKHNPYLFLDLNKVRSKPTEFKWLCEPTYVRFANHVCEGNSYNLKHSVPYQFDGIFFIDKTTGSRLIK